MTLPDCDFGEPKTRVASAPLSDPGLIASSFTMVRWSVWSPEPNDLHFLAFGPGPHVAARADRFRQDNP